MKRALAAGAFLFLALALCAELGAQGLIASGHQASGNQTPGSQQPPDKGEFTLSVDVSMVLVETTVRDAKGKIVDGLKPEDFRVFEDGVEQRISYFSRDELPLAVALVVDASGSVSPVLPQLHQAAFDTLSQLKPVDQVALYSFASHPERIADLTSDRRTIADAIMGIGSAGGTNIADALYASIEYLGQEARDRRHAVIMISDNQPTAKGDYNGKDVTRLALETQTIVYSIKLGGDRYAHSGDEPDWIPGARWVSDIMPETGGEIVSVAAEGSPQKAMAAVIARLKQRYTLGYQSSNPRRDHAFREIEVRLADHVAQDPKHPYRISARSGYYPAAE